MRMGKRSWSCQLDRASPERRRRWQGVSYRAPRLVAITAGSPGLQHGSTPASACRSRESAGCVRAEAVFIEPLPSRTPGALGSRIHPERYSETAQTSAAIPRTRFRAWNHQSGLRPRARSSRTPQTATTSNVTPLAAGTMASSTDHPPSSLESERVRPRAAPPRPAHRSHDVLGFGRLAPRQDVVGIHAPDRAP